MEESEATKVGISPVIVVHGGAWSVPDSLVTSSLSGVQNAARAGWKKLQEGGSALDAVEAAVTILEDDPAFDAGTGSVLTANETIEMDSIIMCGERLGVGAVACVQSVRNPIQLARLILDKSEHTMLVGAGADRFAREMGMDAVAPSTLLTAAALHEFQLFKTYNQSVLTNFCQREDTKNVEGTNNDDNNLTQVPQHETVGCVALDARGNLACGTSTGGITGKRPGRVGDSPLVGCGGYADSQSAAVSCTGHGESISRVCLARRIVENCEQGLTPEEAIKSGLSFMGRRVAKAGSGGAICIDHEGRPGVAFNSRRMPWATVHESRGEIQENSKILANSGIDPDQVIPFDLT